MAQKGHSLDGTSTFNEWLASVVAAISTIINHGDHTNTFAKCGMHQNIMLVRQALQQHVRPEMYQKREIPSIAELDEYVKKTHVIHPWLFSTPWPKAATPVHEVRPLKRLNTKTTIA